MSDVEPSHLALSIALPIFFKFKFHKQLSVFLAPALEPPRAGGSASCLG
jgi:hypothetical protein